MFGLVFILFFVRNVLVMFIMNLWLEVGLCNGVIGKVVDIIFVENYLLLDLLIVVMVKFDYYTGLLFIEFLIKCVLVCFVIVIFYLFDIFYER